MSSMATAAPRYPIHIEHLNLLLEILLGKAFTSPEASIPDIF
jgi:hypothetical protein